MAKKRNRLEIIYDILLVIKKTPQIKRTHLMYKTNLTYVRLNEYLEELKDKDFIELGDSISIKKKGEEFIFQLRKMRDFVDSFGL